MKSRPKTLRRALEVGLVFALVGALLVIGGTGLPEAVGLAFTFGLAGWVALRGDSGRCGRR